MSNPQFSAKVKEIRANSDYGSENSKALAMEIEKVKCFVMHVLAGNSPQSFDWEDSSELHPLTAQVASLSAKDPNRYDLDVLFWGSSFLNKEQFLATLTAKLRELSEKANANEIDANVLQWGFSKISLAMLVEKVGELMELHKGSELKSIIRSISFNSDAPTAIGSYPVSIEIPEGSVVKRVWYEVSEALASPTSSATLTLSLEAAGDLRAATAITDPVWATGFHDSGADGAAANMIRTSTAKNIMLDIAGEEMNDGRVVVFVEYI